jgi:hypothetical protein
MPPPPAKQKPKNKPNRANLEKLDLDPDAWPKFEALVKSAAKMGHKPHDAKLGKIAKAKLSQSRRPSTPR